MPLRPARRGSAAIVLAAWLTAATACTSSPRAGSSGPTAGPSSQPTPSAASPGPTAAPGPAVTIRASANGSLLLHGAYPHASSRCVHHQQPTFDARYPGTLSVARAKDGTLSLTV